MIVGLVVSFGLENVLASPHGREVAAGSASKVNCFGIIPQKDPEVPPRITKEQRKEIILQSAPVAPDVQATSTDLTPGEASAATAGPVAGAEEHIGKIIREGGVTDRASLNALIDAIKDATDCNVRQRAGEAFTSLKTVDIDPAFLDALLEAAIQGDHITLGVSES